MSWSAKRQPTLSHSSVESEYQSVANVVAKACWLRNLLHELHTPLKTATLVYCDNVSAVYLSGNLFNINAPNISRWAFIFLETRWLSVIFEFFMFRPPIIFPIVSLKGCVANFSWILDSV